jgi:hypothetical protein
MGTAPMVAYTTSEYCYNKLYPMRLLDLQSRSLTTNEPGHNLVLHVTGEYIV